MTPHTPAPDCPACSRPAPDGSRFCPGCGTPLLAAADETLELPARRRLRRPQGGPSLHRAQRRPLGLEPLALLAGFETAGLLATVILFAIGAWIGGAILLAVSLVVLSLCVTAAHREPEAPLSRVILRGVDRVRSATRVAVVTIGTWVRAIVRLARVKQRRQRLRHELHRQLRPLGEAVYRGDDQRARALKAQARRIEHALAETERERVRLVQRVRTQLAVVRTRHATATQATATLRAQPPTSRART